MTLGTVLNGLRLRQRLSGLRPLDPSSAAGSDGAVDDDFVLLTLPGVEVSDATRTAAVRHALAEGLEVLDLIPANLPPEQTLDLARWVEAVSYRSSPLVAGRGARHAVLVRRDTARRAEVGAPRDRRAFVGVSERLKQHAARTTDLVVAPDLEAVDTPPGERLAELEALYDTLTPLALAIPALRSSLLLAGLMVSPGWGAAALAAFLAQPSLVTAGTDLRPGIGAPVARVLAPFALLRAALAGDDAASEVDSVEARRAAYANDLAQGTQRFLEPRRDTCPWCGGIALVERLRTPDLVQFKPGEFVIDECQSCGLLFQNPRLTIDGLDFYYRDAYDGLGANGIQLLFAQAGASYQGRVDLARRHSSPESWLDVGTGYGHFCLFARGLLPETRFDGLDMGTSIDEAQRRGWIDRAYRGLFPEIVDDVAGAYDLVSMHHYLEHTRDPRAELDAAHRALKPGGHLLIEVPDPESHFARIFGKYWVPWLQPQHQQFLSAAHLTAALEAQGFSVVEVERGQAHQPLDIGGAVGLWAMATAPPPRLPWLDPPTTIGKVTRVVMLCAVGPVALVGLLADRAIQPVVRREGAGWSNAYRVLARRL